MPNTENTVPPGFLLALREAVLDLESAAERAGIAPRELKNLEPPEAAALLNEVQRGSEDAAIGVRIGTMVKAELLGVVGLAAISAPTFGQAVLRCARYKRLFSALEIQIENRRDAAVIRVHHPQASTSSTVRWQIDVELGFLVSFGRRMVSRSFSPVRVDLAVEAVHPSPYAQALGCPTEIGCQENLIVYPPGAFEQPLLGSDEKAHLLLVHSADQKLDAL
ncbi:MAG: AraC family transcriptional regulator ligand-binding domain-containing protein, partial [Myxococcota bacterium]